MIYRSNLELSDSVRKIIVILAVLSALGLLISYFSSKVRRTEVSLGGPGPVSEAVQRNIRVPTEEQMRQIVIGVIEKVSANIIFVRTEWPTPTGVRTILRTVEVTPNTEIMLHGELKDAATYEAELSEYQAKVREGATSLNEPFPSEIRAGTLADLQVYMFISARIKDPKADLLVATNITVPMSPPMPGTIPRLAP